MNKTPARLKQMRRVRHWQESGEQQAMVARYAMREGDLSKAKWYQHESSFEYKGARGLLGIKESDYDYA